MTPSSTPVHEAQRHTVPLALWLPGLIVALGAVVATAHGLYAVAAAAGTPQLIAGLYPVMTDGLAVVAYIATARLSANGRGYAWTVVVLAAGLSGLAQATYLAGGMHEVPTWLRFGVGAWPAIAVAIVAHLLYLIAGRDENAENDRQGTTQPKSESKASRAEHAESLRPASDDAPASRAAVRPAVGSNGQRATQPNAARLNPVQAAPVQSFAVHREAVQPSGPVQPSEGELSDSVQVLAANGAPAAPSNAAAPARDRAEQAARTYAGQYGALPTAARLMQLADVSRGSAGQALKALRSQPAEPHRVDEFPEGQAQQ